MDTALAIREFLPNMNMLKNWNDDCVVFLWDGFDVSNTVKMTDHQLVTDLLSSQDGYYRSRRDIAGV